MKTMRLDRFLSDMASGTRREIKQKIKNGQVCVNGKTVYAPDLHITQDDLVTVQGRPVIYEAYVYYMMNKPAGFLSASEDKRQKTVIDLITDRTRKDLFPVGRLDKDTEGLLLISNDGVLAHQLLAPKKHVAKVYEATVLGSVTQDDVRQFSEGLQIDAFWTARPAELEVLSCDSSPDGDISHIRISIYEGRFHQIKRMFETVGKKVIYLKRLSMGPLVLDSSLSPGQYRVLTDEELNKLKSIHNEGTSR